MLKEILLRILHVFTGHDYEVVGFHNLYGGRCKIISCDCGKEKYTHEHFTGYKRDMI